MEFPIKERTFTTAMVIIATIVVIVLGVLQYEWSNQVSEATSTRLADSLQMSMINWHLDFFRDFSEICIALRVDPDADKPSEWNQYAQRFVVWKKTAAHPNLVSGVYVLNVQDTNTLELNGFSGLFEPVSFPPNLARLREELRDAPSQSSLPDRTSRLEDSRTRGADREFDDFFYPRGPLDGWRFEPLIPALVRPVPRPGSSVETAGGTTPVLTNWIVIVINEKNIREQVMPDLAQRYFSGTEGLDYQLAVVAGDKPGRVIYSSDPSFGDKDVADADGTMNIFARFQDHPHDPPIRMFHRPSENRGPAAWVGVTWFPLLRTQGDDRNWRLVLRHRRGGAMGAFVADSRRRNLAISLGVLFLLVISTAILIITSTRAQRLARLQMDFVTAVSHELRTPLTVISSAAENIVHGVVEGKQQLEQYGSVIGSQAQKLFEMVEQILLFAAIRDGHQRYDVQPLEVTDLLDVALSSTAGLVRAADFRVEQDVEPNLPPVLGDLPALSRCLQNLITNALKYGGEQRWIGVQARIANDALHGEEVQISISDRGIGIDPRDLPHIFEAFYRSSTVKAAQIHGTGLGLQLAKSIVEAMKGRLSVISALGKGSTFTLHMPCLEQPVRHAVARSTGTASQQS